MIIFVKGISPDSRFRDRTAMTINSSDRQAGMNRSQK